MSECFQNDDRIPDRRQQELIRAAQQGCTDSFTVLAIHYGPRLYRFLYQRTGRRQDAEDLVQETLLRCFQHLKSYDSSKSFTTWLFTIAFRLAANHHAKQPPQTCLSVPEMACRPQSAVERREDAEQLWAAVSQLPPSQAMAVELYYLGEMSIRQIAQAMGLTSVYVRVLLYRARKTLLHTAAQQESGSTVHSPVETIHLRKAQV